MSDESVLAGRQLVLDAINELLSELDDGVAWENDTLERYLDGFGALLGSIENSYANTARPLPDNAWELVAATLRGARYYE